MKKKLLLCAILSSVSLSVYPANVLIRNYTDETVFARINNQRRSMIFDGEFIDKEFDQDMRRGLAPLTVASEPIMAIHRKLAGYPNFMKIKPGKSLVFTTALRRFRFKEMRPFQTTLGDPIKTITFIRVTGDKTITGTLLELRDQVNELAKQYGNIKMEVPLSSDDPAILRDKLTETDRDAEYQRIGQGRTTEQSIKLPILEEFTYTLPKGGIKKGIVELQSWGTAVFKPAPR
ncbi:hypothetical protein E3J61_01990 [Candidatus Dependentiae bacterium]|nr:MAG: hypothetical protein E3J61_01990 [Candidatus Dependentiae bacterium]